MSGRVVSLLLAIALLTVAVGGCGQAAPPPTATPEVGIANPASVYCQEHGGQVEIRTAEDGSQYGVCVFPDGSECDEWAYFRGECQPGQ